MLRVSATIITLNEAEHIAAAIDSVAFADEIIVVDSGSGDGTAEIARRKGVRVETREWPGYVEQKNHAAGLARNDWIFSLDADERVTPALAAGTTTSFFVVQAQRDLAQARNNELRSILDYARSAVDFEAVQEAPLR